MKKMFLILLSIWIVASSLQATESVPVRPYLIDDLGLLTKEQAKSLNKTMDKILQNYNVDVHIMVLDGLNSATHAEEVANEKFDNSNFGSGEEKKGVFLILDPVGEEGDRHYYTLTNGYAYKVFPKYILDDIHSKMLELLKEENFSEALEVYLEELEVGLREAEENGLPPSMSSNVKYWGMFIGILISLFASFGITRYMIAKMNTAIKQEFAGEYIVQDSLELTNSQDIFLYSHVSKTEKSKSSDNESNRGGSGGSY